MLVVLQGIWQWSAHVLGVSFVIVCCCLLLSLSADAVASVLLFRRCLMACFDFALSNANIAAGKGGHEGATWGGGRGRGEVKQSDVMRCDVKRVA